MRNLPFLCPFLALFACASPSTEESAASDSALSDTVLTVDRCRTPTGKEAPQVDASGRPVDGSILVTMGACVVGGAGEDGTAVLRRAEALFGDTAFLADVDDGEDHKLFAETTIFNPHGALGSDGGVVQDADVTVNWDHAPSGRLRITRREAPDGTYTFRVVNATAITAEVLVFEPTAVKPGDFAFELTMRPVANGIVVDAKVGLVLQLQKYSAGDAQVAVNDILYWMKSTLTKS